MQVVKKKKISIWRADDLLQRRIWGDFMRISAFSGSKLSFFSFSHNMSEANASYCGVLAEQCFIAEWNEAASSEKAFYEARLAAYEAHLRCRKRRLAAA